MVARLEQDRVDAVCAAALTGFGFVFVHPFEDGNGHIHRFLIHHSLAKLGYTPQGIVFPVSAVMLRDLAKYDQVLTAFSGKIGPFLEYHMDEAQRMTVLNETKSLILQNKGRLAKNKRDLFSEVTDEELTKIENAIGSVEE